VAAADVPDPAGHRDHRARIAAERALQLQVEEIPVLGVLGLVAEQPLGAAQPARSDHAVAAQEVVDGDPDGGHGGRAGPAVVQVAAVGLLEDGRRLLEVAKPPGGVGQGVQVAGGQLALRPGGVEAVAGGRPVVASVGVPGRLQDPGHVVHRPLSRCLR
jgi:hypothetical protein